MGEDEATATIHVLNALADLPPERATIALAMAKLASLPTEDALPLAKRVLDER